MPEGNIYQSFFKLYQSQNYDEVFKLADNFNDIALSDPSAAFLVAASHFTVGHFQDCFELLVQLEAPLSQNSDFWTLSGSCSRRLGRLAQAHVSFKNALKINPSSISIKNNFANLLVDLQQFDSAITILEQILTSNPDYIDAKKNINRARFMKEQNHLNVSRYSQSLQSDPNSNIYDPLMQAFSVDEAMRTMGVPQISLTVTGDSIASLISSDPHLTGDPIADKLRLAHKAYDESNFNFALELCSQIFSSNGPSLVLFMLLSDIYIGLKRFQEAEFYLLHAGFLDAPNTKIYFNLITLARLRGDFKSARFYLDMLAGLDPHNKNLQSISESLSQTDSISPINFIDSISYFQPDDQSIASVQ